MQYLERLSATPQASWYAVHGDHEGAVERFVVSTPGSRAVCNRPEVLGVEFSHSLHEGVAAALVTASFRDMIERHPQERVCVVNFLRGGLNFQIRDALYTAYRFNRHSSAFMSSQRFRREGRWFVKEDMYRKLEIPKDAVLVMGDVVATGVTMSNGLNVIIDHIIDTGSSVRGLVFFTIGCHKAEKILEALHQRMKQEFPGYERTVLVYFEGKFRLVDSRSELRIGIPGTDLIRRRALIAPELELSQWEEPAYLLERCAIYDAGSRAFDIPTYVGDVSEYWDRVAGFAAEGWTLAEAVGERWPEAADTGKDDFDAERRSRWHGVDERFLDKLYRRCTTFWGAGGVDTAEALAAVCRERLATLREVGGIVDAPVTEETS